VPFCREFTTVLSNPSIGAVALATPAATHYEMARAALEAGKDVFVEKPLAIDVKQGEDLVELAKARRRVLMVGHILRYHPAILKLHDLIQDGALGQINYLYSNRLNIGKIRTEENILWSFAPHDISVMLSLLGEMPNRISCHGGTYLNREIFDVTLSHFDFPSGVPSQSGMETPRAYGHQSERRSHGPRQSGAVKGGVPGFPRLYRVSEFSLD